MVISRGEGPCVISEGKLTMSQTVEAASTPRKRFTKVRAILAGGIVLGVGAAITLAAWNDSEFATGRFASGSFNLEGSTDGTSFTDHASAPGATLDFAVNPSNLSPGDTVAAPFSVRLAAGTTNNADVQINVTTADEVSGLEYTIVSVADHAACTAAATGSEVVPSGAVSAATNVGGFSLTKGTSDDVAGEATTLCVIVSAPSVTQNQSGSVTFEFKATSKES